ncbi:MAG: hypothetical protein A3E36_00570 [Candidatus Andersenbacteria bacterium RIFCSPHIGHO2_12_FULL_45_11b]|uniref:Uncharacterized protein n=1 Tax=Candidatus Andersenbacteria bacterium RIFCSPHIGHO2_12_FULL_45_11b TaxID=1797282 RepID=A0A1G1X554_9BACT|nr:MAG: hypothetical protein A3E36_00570 [Candidatus Andersenbacteria bacterium RIFCSPHIGHO2_12_FULL_45_11b]
MPHKINPTANPAKLGHASQTAKQQSLSTRDAIRIVFLFTLSASIPVGISNTRMLNAHSKNKREICETEILCCMKKSAIYGTIGVKSPKNREVLIMYKVALFIC